MAKTAKIIEKRTEEIKRKRVRVIVCLLILFMKIEKIDK